MKGFIAVLAVALALPAGAFAADRDLRLAQRDQVHSSSLAVTPADLRAPDQRSGGTPADLRAPDQRSGGTSATFPDLRAPDQRDRSTAPVSAKGTDVAAPDQQAFVSGPRAIVLPAAARQADDGTDWGSAGLGAAGALALVVILLDAGMFVRRRSRRASSVAG